MFATAGYLGGGGDFIFVANEFISDKCHITVVDQVCTSAPVAGGMFGLFGWAWASSGGVNAFLGFCGSTTGRRWI